VAGKLPLYCIGGEQAFVPSFTASQSEGQRTFLYFCTETLDKKSVSQYSLDKSIFLHMAIWNAGVMDCAQISLDNIIFIPNTALSYVFMKVSVNVYAFIFKTRRLLWWQGN
jgi:hypothetical protein